MISVQSLTRPSHFVTACYGCKGNNLSDARYEVWLTKTGKRKISRLPPLKSLPPTSEAFAENVKRVHLQVCIWKHAMDSDPPNLDPTLHGWQKEVPSKSLIPVPNSASTKPAPTEILEMIRCGCASDEPCQTARCGCMTAQLSCTVFCACTRAEHCNNRWTRHNGLQENKTVMKRKSSWRSRRNRSSYEVFVPFQYLH